MHKKGVSPAIATVLLIGVVIALSTVVFFWFRSFVHESNIKFGKDISLNCQDVQFKFQYQSGNLSIVNSGNVPVYSFNVQMGGGGGSYTSKDISAMTTTWPRYGLGKGGAVSLNINLPSGTKKLTLAPILKGTLSSGQQQTYSCDINKYGQTLTI